MSLILLTGGRVWRGGSRLEDVNVLVEGTRIAKVLPSDEGTIDQFPAATVIDLAGRTLLPGLINAHVHLSWDGTSNSVEASEHEPMTVTTLKAASFARDILMTGVTTVRDCGCRGPIAIHLRNAIKAGLLPGPRIIAAGQCITMTGGHNRAIGSEVDGEAEVRKAVRQQLKAGADFIKVIATGGVTSPGVSPQDTHLSLGELQVAVEEAHTKGRAVSSHAQGTTGIRNSLQAGVDTLEHGTYLTPDLIDAMLRQGTYFVPTLTPIHRILEGEKAGLPPYVVQKARAVKEAWWESFAACVKAGVPTVAGTDAGVPWNPHGSVAIELYLMVAAGMSTQQALASATSVAARAIGLGEEVGSIEPGMFADLIAVDGDPLKEIRALDNVTLVIKDGIPVTR